MAKRFFYVCAGILMLVLAYSSGARKADAQANSTIMGFAVSDALSGRPVLYVMTPNGDVYLKRLDFVEPGDICRFPVEFTCNFWTGAVSVDGKTWSDVKGVFGKPIQDR